MANLLQIKRGLKSNIPVLSSGEPGFCTDTKEVFIGDGSSNYRIGPSDNNFTDAYKSQLDNLEGDSTFTNLTVNGNTTLGDQTSDLINFVATANSNLDMGNNSILNVSSPVNNTDVTNKSYVDDLVSKGLTSHEAVLSKDIVDPSTITTPTTGDRYWIGGTGVGDWSGQDYNIATYNGTTWDFETVTSGDMASVDDLGVFYYFDDTTTSLKRLSTAIGNHAASHESGGSDTINHDSLTGFVSNEHIDWTTDQGATNLNDLNITKTAVTQYTYSYADLSLAIGDTPVDGQTNEPISSNWAFDHNAAATGVHGAGSETLLHTGSTINGGSFA